MLNCLCISLLPSGVALVRLEVKEACVMFIGLSVLVLGDEMSKNQAQVLTRIPVVNMHIMHDTCMHMYLHVCMVITYLDRRACCSLLLPLSLQCSRLHHVVQV